MEMCLILLLLDHGLPLALTLSDGEAVDLGLDLRPPFAHVVLNVKNKGVLAEVCVHHLPWSLKAHGRVQVRLQERERERNEFDLESKSKQETMTAATGKRTFLGNQLVWNYPCKLNPRADKNNRRITG